THPSFTIFPESQRWWCFGCQRGGDVIEFVRLLEGIGFRDAVERLEAVSRQPRVVATPRPPSDRGVQRALTAPLTPDGQRALDVAIACYVRELMESPPARRYLHARGLSEALVRAARLGYCSGVRLCDALRLHGVPVRAGWAVGLFSGREGRERFSGRITIPEIRDGHARGLTSRLLEDDTDAPRYLSLPGPRPLYGTEHVRGQPAVIGVEGYFDALTLWGWRLPAFAAGGVSLPADALESLCAARAIYLAFDQDAPGQEAARVLSRKLGPRLRLLTLPAGVKDVNELGLRQDGERQFRACLQRAAQLDHDAWEAA
ncbi:MAG: CHC2 zinc finger domain-containing protein, partial [Ktedonobacterales bacterium]